MLSSRGWLIVGSLLGVVAVGCGPSTDPVDAGTTPTMDTGSTGAPDANRDAARRMGDSFDNYEEAITAARTQECECTWMDQGFKSAAACVEYTLATEDIVDCAREGYDAARSAAAEYYDCVTPALDTYAACRMEAGCDADAAIMACVEAVNGAFPTCPELPSESTDAYSECFEREVIGPAGMCPESGAPWMGVGTFTGDSTLAGNDSNPDGTCFEGGEIPEGLEISPERAHAWIAPTPGTYIIDTVGTEHDTILYVRNDCMGAITVCNDDIDTMGGMYQSRVMVTATTAGQQFIITVDGYSAQSSGPFTVNVTMGATPDAGPSGTPDAGPAADAFTPPADAFTPPADAFVATDDAFAG